MPETSRMSATVSDAQGLPCFALLGGGMVIFICSRNTELNTYKAGGGRGECIGTRLSLRSAPMTGGRTAQARIFRSTDAEAHETGTHPTENKKNHSRRWRAAGSSSAPAAAAQVASSCPLSASNT
jgi:hypothetical protein